MTEVVREEVRDARDLKLSLVAVQARSLESVPRTSTHLKITTIDDCDSDYIDVCNTSIAISVSSTNIRMRS